MTQHDAVWIDQEYDREHAVTGPSRYGTLIEHNVREFADTWGDIAPVGFACTAWRLATICRPTRPEAPVINVFMVSFLFERSNFRD